MRWLALFAVCLACKGKQAPPPRHDDARVVAADATPADATPADTAPDAAAASTTITPDGVGPITAKVKDEEQFAALLPGFSVKTEHVKSDHEEADYKFDEIIASKGTTQVLRAVVQDGALFKVEVKDPTFTTSSGVAVGMTVGDLVAKLPDAKCVYEKYDAESDAEHVDQALRCQAASLPQVLFDIDYATLTVPEGAVSTKTIGKRKIVQIIWLAARP